MKPGTPAPDPEATNKRSLRKIQNVHMHTNISRLLQTGRTFCHISVFLIIRLKLGIGNSEWAPDHGAFNLRKSTEEKGTILELMSGCMQSYLMIITIKDNYEGGTLGLISSNQQRQVKSTLRSKSYGETTVDTDSPLQAPPKLPFQLSLLFAIPSSMAFF